MESNYTPSRRRCSAPARWGAARVSGTSREREPAKTRLPSLRSPPAPHPCRGPGSRAKRDCRRRARVGVHGDGSQASRESSYPLPPVPPRPPSPTAPRGGRGPGRGAQGPFANQKNRRAQNDLGRQSSGLLSYFPTQRDARDPRRRRSCCCPMLPKSGASFWNCYARETLMRPILGSRRLLPASKASRVGRSTQCQTCSPSPPDLRSGGPARGLHAPPGPNGPSGPSCSPCTVTPTSSSYPACRFLSPPSAHKEFAVDSCIIR